MEDILKKENAKAVVADLVQKFSDHLLEYKDRSYNEATLRIDFLNKFFKALGWDVENDEGLPPSFREVVTEDTVQVDGRTKSPDYSFRRRNGERKFFVEAKKPAVNISSHTASAFQLRRYGWNADIGLSILTSFEYFAIYDCSSRPKENQNSRHSRLKIIHFEEYLDEFEYLWKYFSRDSVHSGSLDEFVLAKDRRGSLSVDNDFLKSLDDWRIKLAKAIFKQNEIEEYELNIAVQKLIDRIIFLRIAEDRNIEHYGSLQLISKSKDVYSDFLAICSKANDKYNSGLFSKNSVLESIKIDSETLSQILKEMYFPLCPYEFSVLPIDILGKAYEQFLGKVIVVNRRGNLVISQKPEVKKAGGVFYTPKYIVESIVENTLGKRISGKDPEFVSKVKILDPACGSGTFLLTAYEYLLKWYKDYYVNFSGKMSKKNRGEILTPHGELTTKFKGQILLDNLHGVDVDRNAVEVTKLSLLLKCLEGESSSSLDAQISLFNERVLPSIDKNITSGNSLVDFDIYGLSPDLEDDIKIKRKINAFNWEISYKNIFSEGGFDIVIGNPPYVRQELFSDLKPYLERKFQVYNGVADLYVYFFEKSYNVMKTSADFSVIVANKWFRTNYGEELRKWLKTVSIESIKDFGDLPVFTKATTYPCIITIKKASKKSHFLFADLITQGVRDPKKHDDASYIKVEVDRLSDSGWVLADEMCLDILDSLVDKTESFENKVNRGVNRGIVTGKNEVFVIDENLKNALICDDVSSREIIKPFVEGKDVKAFKPIEVKNYLIFTRRGINLNKYPAIKKYLKQFKKVLLPKPSDWQPEGNETWPGRKAGTYKWYEIQDSIDYHEDFEKNKIIYSNMCKKPEFTYDDSGLYTNQRCFIVPNQDLFLLGVLNSEFTHFWFELFLPKLRGGFYEPNYVVFKNFPVVKIDKDDLNKNKLVVEIIDCVKKLLSLHKQNESNELENEIEYYTNKINSLVYQAYDLNEKQSKHISEIVDNVKRARSSITT